MKAILILIILLAAAVLLGWLSFSASDGTASVTVNSEKVEDDTSRAVEKGKHLIREGVDAIDDDNDDDDRTEVDVNGDSNSPDGRPVPANPESGQ